MTSSFVQERMLSLMSNTTLRTSDNYDRVRFSFLTLDLRHYNDIQWTISSLHLINKWIIRNHSDIFPVIPLDPEAGKAVVLVENPTHPHHWLIKRQSEATQLYLLFKIYPPSQPDLC